jgi:hypothetical protein
MPPSHAAALYTPPPMATEASGMPIQKIACKEGAPNDPRCNCTSPETNQTTQLGWHITVSAYAENTLCLHARVCVYSSPGPFRPSPCPPQPDLLTHGAHLPLTTCTPQVLLFRSNVPPITVALIRPRPSLLLRSGAPPIIAADPSLRLTPASLVSRTPHQCSNKDLTRG